MNRPTERAPIAIGSLVRPAFDGEDGGRRILAWTRLRGVVVDTWTDNGRGYVEVRWRGCRAYPSRMEADYVMAVQP